MFADLGQAINLILFCFFHFVSFAPRPVSWCGTLLRFSDAEIRWKQMKEEPGNEKRVTHIIGDQTTLASFAIRLNVFQTL